MEIPNSLTPQQIHQLRRKARLDQADVAVLLHYSVSQISRFERGVYVMPQEKMIEFCTLMQQKIEHDRQVIAIAVQMIAE